MDSTTNGDLIPDGIEDITMVNGEPSKQYTFVPEVECSEVNNGVIKATVTNIEDLFDYLNDANLAVITEHCLEIKYQGELDPEDVMMTTRISFAEIGEDGTLFIKIPVPLNPYKFRFNISGVHPQTADPMTPSKMQCVDVPSFLKDNNYRKGESVSFREIDSFHTIGAEIVEVLGDDMFTVQYLKFDESKNGDPLERESYILATTNVHISRLYHESTVPENEIDLVNYDVINQYLLLQRNDDEAIKTFHAIQQAVCEHLYVEAFEMYGLYQYGMHWSGMNDFVSYNVYQFLFTPKMKVSVHCLIEGDTHHALEMRNMRQSDIRTKYELMKMGAGKVHFQPSMHDRLDYACDWCRCAITEWAMVFQCTESKLTDRHDYCKRCIGTVITHYGPLNLLLWELLKDDLIEDCVSLISSFVIGHVVFTELAEKDDEGDDVMLQKVGIKRPLNEIDAPPSKRSRVEI